MNHKAPKQNKRGQITDDATIEQIAAALGLKAGDWKADLPDITFDDVGTSETPASSIHEEDKHLKPTEIIDELHNLGRAVPLVAHRIGSCIEELQAALRLASGTQRTGQGGWRVKGMPVPVPTPTENAERIAMLLGHAFSLFASLPRICESQKGYDIAAFGRVEAALERLCDSPETLEAAALSDPEKTKTTADKNLNR